MSSAAVPKFAFSTQDIPVPARFDMWREMMSATHDVALPEVATADFDANVSLWNLGPLMVSHGEFSEQVFTRSDRNIRRDHIDHFGLFVQGRGTRIVHVEGRPEHVLHTGDVLVVDMSQSTDCLASAGSSGTLYLPRNLVEHTVPQLSRFHGSVLHGGPTGLLAHHVLSMGDHLPVESGMAVEHLAIATRELALSCLVDHVEGPIHQKSGLQGALRRQVERYVDQNLGDPDLCALSICSELGLSRSALYRLFEVHAGVAGFIKMRRLHRIRAILVARADPRAIADIALDNGFRSAAHFSREFRLAFGVSPSEVRTGTPSARFRPDDHIPGIEQMFRSLHG